MFGTTPAMRKSLGVVGVLAFIAMAGGVLQYKTFGIAGGLMTPLTLFLLMSVGVSLIPLGIPRWVLVGYMIACGVIGAAVGWGIDLLLH